MEVNKSHSTLRVLVTMSVTFAIAAILGIPSWVVAAASIGAVSALAMV